MTDDLKEIAVDISKRSYRALIPDLYKGKVGVEVEEAKHVCAGIQCFVCTALGPCATVSYCLSSLPFQTGQAHGQGKSACSSLTSAVNRHIVAWCGQIREGLDWDQAIKELHQTVDYLRSTGSPKANSIFTVT